MNGVKRIFGIFVMLMLVCGFVLNAIAQQEVIVNGGFETGSLDPWFNVAPGDPWWVSGSPGDRYAYTYNGGFGAAIQQEVLPTPTNNVTSVTYWARGYYNARDELPLTFTFYYQSGGSSSGGPWVTQIWSLYNITNSLTPNEVLIAVRITAGGDPYFEPWHYLDNVSIMANLVTPNVQIDLLPLNPPIVIPANGGFFDFTISVANAEASPQYVDIWTMCQAPNSFWVGPIFWICNITLPANTTITRLRTQYVPVFAPAGNYTYEGRIGFFPDVAWDTDNFTFEKQVGLDEDATLAAGEWVNTGEAFANEHIAQQSATHNSSFIIQNSPNPFNPTTVVSFELRVPSYVSLRVYDTAGRLVQTLVEGWREAGAQEASFDGTSLASGVYHYRLTAGNFTASGKMVLLK